MKIYMCSMSNLYTYRVVPIMEKIVNLLKNKEFRRGFVFAAGALLVIDNVLFHWILKLHHVIEGPHALEADFLTFIFGLILIVYSILRK